MGQGTTDPGAGGGDDFGGEGDLRNAGIRQYLQGYIDSIDQNGWGDASSENAPSRPQVNTVVTVPTAAADDDWGNINNPRAFTALAQSLLVAGTNGDLKTAASGILQSMAANGRIGTYITGMLGASMV
jgi:hypothetical protein